MHKIAVIHYHQKYQAIILQTVNDMEKRKILFQNALKRFIFSDSSKQSIYNKSFMTFTLMSYILVFFYISDKITINFKNPEK